MADNITLWLHKVAFTVKYCKEILKANQARRSLEVNFFQFLLDWTFLLALKDRYILGESKKAKEENASGNSHVCEYIILGSVSQTFSKRGPQMK